MGANVIKTMVVKDLTGYGAATEPSDRIDHEFPIGTVLIAGPIDMVLYCPRCHVQHIDEPETEFVQFGAGEIVSMSTGWDSPPHRSHLCKGCGCIWRPADVPTNGVKEIKTKGKADNYVASET